MTTMKRGRGQFDGWSKSSLKSLLEGCSWQWALQRLGGLQGPPTPHSAAGTGMHAAIEWHEQCRIEGKNVPEWWELLSEAKREANADGVNIPADWQRIHGDVTVAEQWAADLTDVWYGSDVRQTMLRYTPIAVEPHLETENVPGPHNLRGYVDWIGRDDNGVATIIDYKSASTLKRWSKPDSHLVEATSYLWLAATWGELVPGEPIRMEWHVISRKGDSKILEGPYLDSSMSEFLFARVEDANRMWDGNLFTPNTSWNLCQPAWCNFYHGCQVTGTLSPDMLDFSTVSPAASSSPLDAQGSGTPNPS
jgi:hypothetical protein